MFKIVQNGEGGRIFDRFLYYPIHWQLQNFFVYDALPKQRQTHIFVQQDTAVFQCVRKNRLNTVKMYTIKIHDQENFEEK